MLDVILDSVFDSIKAFVVIFLIYIILSFFENKIINKLSRANKIAPIYASGLGLIPQCGISVVAADLYTRKYITTGTLIAVFLSCSDEAIPVILSSSPENSLMVIPLIISKFIIGFSIGLGIDFIGRKNNVTIANDMDNNLRLNNNQCFCGCCEQIDDTPFDKHLWYPFVHSLKLFLYVLIINVCFGMITYLLGEDNLVKFLENGKYFSPLFACLVGIIPNCASSIIIAELFISGALSFGATLAGLCINAGLGMVLIFKNKNSIKNNLVILSTMILTSIVIGYLFCLIFGF